MFMTIDYATTHTRLIYSFFPLKKYFYDRVKSPYNVHIILYTLKMAAHIDTVSIFDI